MALHYSRDQYTFSADAHTVTIHPGPKPITLQRWELEQLGLAIRDDYQVPLAEQQDEEPLIAGILSSLTEALSRCEGGRHAWTRRNLRRAMVLIGGLDEKSEREILEQEGI